jgi:hypothetical protein
MPRAGFGPATCLRPEVQTLREIWSNRRPCSGASTWSQHLHPWQGPVTISAAPASCIAWGRSRRLYQDVHICGYLFHVRRFPRSENMFCHPDHWSTVCLKDSETQKKKKKLEGGLSVGGGGDLWGNEGDSKIRFLSYVVTIFSHLTKHLNPWSRVLLEKLTVAQLLKKFSNIYRTRRFITLLKRACHWTLSWATWIQSDRP